MFGGRESLWLGITRVLMALLIVSGLLSAILVADTISMIVGGAGDLRHYAWAVLGGSAAFLAVVLAVLLFRLGSLSPKRGKSPSDQEPG